MFISPWRITRLDDRRGGEPVFTRRHPAHRMDVLLLSLCRRVVWVFWASAPVIEVGVGQTLRWLLTLGILSFISLSSSLWSFLGCLRGVGPLRNLVCNPDHTLSHRVPCSLHPGCQHLHPSFLHSKAGLRWWQTQRLRMQEGGTVAWARLGLVFGSPLRSFILFPLLAHLVILLVDQFCCGQSVWRTLALWVVSVSKGHVCCICISCLARGLHQGL